MRPTWALACGLLIELPGLAWGWQRVVGGTPDPGRVSSLRISAQGDIVAGGRYGTGPAGDDGLVVRLAAADGAELWRTVVAGSGAGDDLVRKVALLSGGDVVAMGAVVNLATGSDGLVARLGSADGTPAWRRDLDGGSAGADAVRAGLLVDDDVIAVGTTTRADLTGPFVVWRLSGQDGRTLWETPVDGPSSAARVVATDGSALYVAGHVANAPTGTQIIVVKLDAATGMVQWNVPLAGTGTVNDVVQAIAVIASRVIVAADLHTSPTAPDAVVVALDAATGAEAWRRTFDGDAAGADTDRTWALAARSPDAVVVATTLQSVTTGEDLVVARLDAATGVETWRTTVDGATSDDDEARDVEVDATGDVLAGGRSRNGGFDGLVVKLAGATGQEIWRSAVRGSSGGDAVLALASGPGVVAAGGFTSNGPGGNELTVALLSGASGGSLPCGNGTDDPGEACDDGNPTAGDGCRADCTIERCGDGIRDPQEACDPAPGTTSACCRDDCASEPDGTVCDDGDVCTNDDTCSGGACTAGPGVRCDDGDPCTIDVCTLDGCAHSQIGGVSSATCVLARPRIAAACPGGLPRAIGRAFDRMTDRLGKAATATGKKRARLLKVTRSTARTARMLGKALGRRHEAARGCASVVVAEMDELIGRLRVLLND